MNFYDIIGEIGIFTSSSFHKNKRSKTGNKSLFLKIHWNIIFVVPKQVAWKKFDYKQLIEQKINNRLADFSLVSVYKLLIPSHYRPNFEKLIFSPWRFFNCVGSANMRGCFSVKVCIIVIGVYNFEWTYAIATQVNHILDSLSYKQFLYYTTLRSDMSSPM